MVKMFEHASTKTSTIHHDAQPNSARNLEEGLIMEDIALEPPTALDQLGEAINGSNALTAYSRPTKTEEAEEEEEMQEEDDLGAPKFSIEENRAVQPPPVDDNMTAPSDEGQAEPIGIFDTCPNTPGGASTVDGTTISSIGSASARQAMIARRHEQEQFCRIEQEQFFLNEQELREAQQQAEKELLRSQASMAMSSTESNSILEDYGGDDDDDQTEVAGVGKEGRARPVAQRASSELPRHYCLSFLNQRRKFELAAVLLSLIAFVLTGIATDRCDFVHVGNDDLQNYWELPDRNVGLVQFEMITSECTYWFDNPHLSSSFYDNVWHAARVMSVTATILGLMLVGFICTLSCIAYRAVVMQRLAFGSLIIPLLYGMSFMIFGSDMCQAGTCKIGIGGLVMILGTIAWFMLAIVLFMIPESNHNQYIKTAATDTEGTDQRTLTALNFQRNRILLLAAIVVVMTSSAVVNVSVILGREAGDEAGGTMSPPTTESDLDTKWLQTGETTMGPYPDSPDYVVISGDASVMSLIGKESVLVMDYDATKGLWYPFGGMIPANLDSKGWGYNDRVTKVRATSASVSEDGRTIAVGSSNWASNAGQNYEFGNVQVWMYDATSNQWLTMGHPIAGKAKGDSFGSKVAISDDGRRLAVLAGGHYDKLKPYVRVYHYNDVLGGGGTWVQVGGDLELEATWVPSGFAFSGDGTTVALGSLRIGRLGLVTVWQYDEGVLAWKRQGSTIGSDSSSRDDKFGESVALSFDGSVVVAGDPSGAPGYARVLAFLAGEWKQLGQDLECSTNNGQCARDVAISNYGSIVAITGYDAYQIVSVYSMAEGQDQWEQVGRDIVGTEPKAMVQSTAVDMSNDGQSIAFGITSQETMTHVWRYNGDSFNNVPLQNSPPTETDSQATQNPSAEAVSPESTPLPPVTQSDEMQPEDIELATAPTQNASNFSDESSVPVLQNETAQPLQPWTQTALHGDVYYFLFGYTPRIERYDMATRQFLPSMSLPTEHGVATAFGVGRLGQIYVAYEKDVYGYSANGNDEAEIKIEAKADVVDFQFDGDLVFINAGRYLISVDANTNTLIKEFYSNHEFTLGTSISNRHNRVFGRTQNEMASGRVIRRSDLWFKEYNDRGEFVSEKVSRLNEQAGLQSAARTWLFPDQTRLVDDKGYVFSVANGDLVYSIDTQEILDVAWVGDEAMIALHANGLLTSISQELVPTGNMTLDFSPTNLAVNNGEAYTFAFDSSSQNGVSVSSHNLGLLGPSLEEPLDATDLSFVPGFPFLGNDGQLYMLSKGHSRIFAMTPGTKVYTDSIKLDDIPKYVAYSSTNNDIYTYRESGVLSKIDLKNENRSEVEIARLSSEPLGLSTAGEFIFVSEKSGSFATHYTFFNNGTLVSAVDRNHRDEEYVWSQANKKMFFFRQADPTDLMTEHIFENGTIGIRVDSYLNNNSGFEHPIRVDPHGRHAVLGSGIVHNARTLERLDISLANSVHDIAFTDTAVRTIRHAGENAVQLQQWNGTTFELMRETHVPGRAHRLLALSANTTVALTTDAFGRPVVYTIDSDFNVV